MITFVNCSPRLNSSNSKFIIDDIIKNIDEKYYIINLYISSFDDVFSYINKSDKVVFVFPLYVDAPPSKLLEFFEYVEKRESKKEVLIYAICQCGFLESKHNDIAIRIVECFCQNNCLEFLGSIKIGAGEILGNSNFKKYTFINYDYYNKIKIFSYNLEYGKQVSLNTTIKFVGIHIYSFLANIHWKEEIKKYKLNRVKLNTNKVH